MKFYGQWDPPVDEVLYENYFKDVNNGFFIEAGAYDGVTGSCCKFFEDLGWKGINIEPALSHYNDLVINRPNSINLNIGISNKNQVLKFKNVITNCNIDGYVYEKGTLPGDGNGSFEHANEHMKELLKYDVSFEEYDVQTKDYNTLIKENNISGVDLMCLDVEGFEFKVLEGFINSTILPSVMCIEYSYIGLKKLKKYISKIGYVFDFISFNNAYFHHKNFKCNNDVWFGSTNMECTVVNGNVVWIKL